MYGSLSRTTQIHCTYQRWVTWLECQVPASKHQSLKQTLKRKSLTSSPLPPKHLNISSLFSFMSLHVWYHLEGGSINTRANGMLCSNQSESQAIVTGNHAPPLRSGHLPLPGFIHFLRFTSHFKGSFSLPKTMSIATFNATHIYPQLRCLHHVKVQHKLFKGLLQNHKGCTHFIMTILWWKATAVWTDLWYPMANCAHVEWQHYTPTACTLLNDCLPVSNSRQI